jgi:DNA-binding response OmpR family regulator
MTSIPGWLKAIRPSLPRSDYVLIVGDDATFSSLLKTELATAGLEALPLPDTATAREMLARTPRAIVLDLRLAGLRGTDLFTRPRPNHVEREPVDDVPEEFAQ